MSCVLRTRVACSPLPSPINVAFLELAKPKGNFLPSSAPLEIWMTVCGSGTP